MKKTVAALLAQRRQLVYEFVRGAYPIQANGRRVGIPNGRRPPSLTRPRRLASVGSALHRSAPSQHPRLQHPAGENRGRERVGLRSVQQRQRRCQFLQSKRQPKLSVHAIETSKG
jgi:hypothetical protein